MNERQSNVEQKETTFRFSPAYLVTGWGCLVEHFLSSYENDRRVLDLTFPRIWFTHRWSIGDCVMWIGRSKQGALLQRPTSLLFGLLGHWRVVKSNPNLYPLPKGSKM
jgi:hypothetical protein